MDTPNTQSNTPNTSFEPKLKDVFRFKPTEHTIEDEIQNIKLSLPSTCVVTHSPYARTKHTKSTDTYVVNSSPSSSEDNKEDTTDLPLDVSDIFNSPIVSINSFSTDVTYKGQEYCFINRFIVQHRDGDGITISPPTKDEIWWILRRIEGIEEVEDIDRYIEAIIKELKNKIKEGVFENE